MAAVYNYSKARRNLAAVLEQAAREGEVRIKHKDGQVFVNKPESGKGSPLDIEGVSLNISTDEVVAIIREGREKRTCTHEQQQVSCRQEEPEENNFKSLRPLCN